MEPTEEIPTSMFIDMDRGPDYSELEKQNILASILKEPTENSTDTGQQEEMLQADEQPVQEEPKVVSTKLESKPRLRCPECLRYTTENEEQMVRHIRKNHQGLNPFQCTMCEYSTYNKSVFEEHVRIHQGIKPFKCSYCPYRSVSKKNKNKHELIHRKNNPLKCDLCPFIAHHYRSLLCHKQKHADGQTYGTTDGLQCDVCSYNFPSEVALNRHKNDNKSRVCDVCNAKFCSAYYLKKHMTTAHDVKKETFKCQVCGWIGSLRMKVLLHLIHHPNQKVDETLFDLSVLRKHGIFG